MFLSHWSFISLIQLTHSSFKVATDANSLKRIDDLYDNRIFSARIPACHRTKHINWKEIFAILHAFILWHKEWPYGSVNIASDNSIVVTDINKKSIRGLAIRLLHTILLIGTVFDIEIKAHWISMKENIIADAASRYDFKKLADLGFKDQVTALWKCLSLAVKTSALR